MSSLRPKASLSRVSARRSQRVPLIPRSRTLAPPLNPTNTQTSSKRYLLEDEDNLLAGSSSSFIDIQVSNDNDYTLPLGELDIEQLSNTLEELNYDIDGDELSEDDIVLDDLGYDALVNARRQLKYQEVSIGEEEDNVPKIALDNKGRNVTDFIGLVGTLVPIGLQPLSIILPSIGSSRIQGFRSDQSEVLTTIRLKEPASSVKLVFRVQYQTTGISRTNYKYLRSILAIISKLPNTAQLLKDLLNTIDILKSYTKGSLLFLKLREVDVKLNLLVQATGNTKDSIKLYFFDLIDFFKVYLSSIANINKMYVSLSYFVDVPKELYESNVQHSSIRISSGEFAIYQFGPAIYEDK